jgi:DNA-binding PadR family transcriptional regulator
VRRKPGALVPLELSICEAAALLRRRGIREFHGYELAKQLARASGDGAMTAYGTLYRALGRLEAMGVLESRWEDAGIAASESRPARRLYTITAVGEHALETARRAARERIPARARRRWARA